MRSAIICMALAVVTLTVYWQVGNHEFLLYDDHAYVVENVHVNTGLTRANIIWAFTETHSSNWHPITWLSHMVDVQLFGKNPRGHHLTNVTIHVATTLLLFLLLLRLTNAPWKSSFVAALFALHPLHVESVAWVAERKDVLSAFFWFLTLFLYAEYVNRKNLKFYFLALFTFILGLMSKPMLVTLPVIMVFFDFWPLHRYDFYENRTGKVRALLNLLPHLKDKIPFLVCSLASSLVTVYAQSGTIKTLEVLPLDARAANAVSACLKYILKAFWPADQSVFYPFPSSFQFWQVALSFLVLLAVTLLVLRAGSRQPYLVTGWFWFLIGLIPVIGLVQVGIQSMADRYTYIPLTGIFIAVAWGIPELTKNQLLTLFATITILAATALTWRQLPYWQDNIVLFRQALQNTSGNMIAHNNLGVALAGKGRYEEAAEEYLQAIEISPNYIDAYYNFGNTLFKMKRFNEAIEAYRKAIEIYPAHAKAHNNLGVVLFEKGETTAAIAAYGKALEFNPSYVAAHVNLGEALEKNGQIDAAIKSYRKALEIKPDSVAAQKYLEKALANQSRSLPAAR